jgi:hypothetical protein
VDLMWSRKPNRTNAAEELDERGRDGHAFSPMVWSYRGGQADRVGGLAASQGIATDDQPSASGAPAGRVSDRLRRSRLLQWLTAYLAAAWMALQVADPLREIWNWPIGFQRGITLGLALGVVPASIVSWFHGEKGRQGVCFVEVFLIATSVLAAGVVIARTCS